MNYSIILVRNVRAMRGDLSLAEFSQEIGIAKSTLEAIEKCKSSIRLDTLEQICDRLDVPMQALLSNSLTDGQMKLLDHLLSSADWYNKLSEPGQREAADAIQRLLLLRPNNNTFPEENQN